MLMEVWCRRKFPHFLAGEREVMRSFSGWEVKGVGEGIGELGQTTSSSDMTLPPLPLHPPPIPPPGLDIHPMRIPSRGEAFGQGPIKLIPWRGTAGQSRPGPTSSYTHTDTCIYLLCTRTHHASKQCMQAAPQRNKVTGNNHRYQRLNKVVHKQHPNKQILKCYL